MSKGLKAWQQLSHLFACGLCQYWKDNKCNNRGECIWLDIEKELKALAYLKELGFIEFGEVKSGYCIGFAGIGIKIPKKKYDLLKEVMTND